MKFNNLTVIGTSHIARESVKEVEKAILEQKPAIVAIELDESRMQGLLHPRKKKYSLKDIKKVGAKGYLFALLGEYVEKKLGKLVGVSPGTEMLTAYKAATSQGARVALVDQDIQVTLKRISSTLSWKEKWHFVVDIAKTVFSKEKVEFDLSTVPPEQLIKKLMTQVKIRYPNMYRVLVVERNQVMAKNLAKLMNEEQGLILAVVGAGHEKELVRLVKKYLN